MNQLWKLKWTFVAVWGALSRLQISCFTSSMFFQVRTDPVLLLIFDISSFPVKSVFFSSRSTLVMAQFFPGNALNKRRNMSTPCMSYLRTKLAQPTCPRTFSSYVASWNNINQHAATENVRQCRNSPVCVSDWVTMTTALLTRTDCQLNRWEPRFSTYNCRLCCQLSRLNNYYSETNVIGHEQNSNQLRGCWRNLSALWDQ